LLPEWAGTKIYGRHLAYVHMLCHLSYKQQDICLDKCPIALLKCVAQKRTIPLCKNVQWKVAGQPMDCVIMSDQYQI